MLNIILIIDVTKEELAPKFFVHFAFGPVYLAKEGLGAE